MSPLLLLNWAAGEGGGEVSLADGEMQGPPTHTVVSPSLLCMGPPWAPSQEPPATPSVLIRT